MLVDYSQFGMVFIVKKSNNKSLSLTLVFIMVFLCLPILSVSADSNTVAYEIEELSMTLDIPTSIVVVTPGIKQSDPLFTENTFDYIQTMSKIRDNNDYLYGKDFADNFEFEVVASENISKVANLNKLSEKKLEEVKNYFAGQGDVFSASVYSSDSFTFIEILRNVTNSDSRYFYKEYYTVYDSMGVTIRIISDNENFSDHELNVIKEIVDSISFPSDRHFSLDGKLNTTLVISFAIIVLSFVVLVYIKIRNINNEKSTESNDESEQDYSSSTASETEKKAVTPESEINERESANISSESENTEALEETKEHTEKTEEQTVTIDSTETNAPVTVEENVSDEKVTKTDEPDIEESKYEIDLDAAIANFEVTPESRRERRERFKEKNQKRKKGFFGW